MPERDSAYDMAVDFIKQELTGDENPPRIFMIKPPYRVYRKKSKTASARTLLAIPVSSRG
jgi:hypothetical protein